MKLQVAMDVLTTEAALELAAQVAPYVDILELGTPLIKSEGLRAITAIKAAQRVTGLGAVFVEMHAGAIYGAADPAASAAALRAAIV